MGKVEKEKNTESPDSKNGLKEINKVFINEVVEFSGGSQPPKSTFSYEKKDGFVRLIQIRDYKSDRHIVYVDASRNKKFCEVDDIMIGRYGPPVFQILRGIKGAYNVALMKAIPDETRLDKEYLFKFLESPSIQDYIVGLSQRSSGQTGVNKKALESYEIPLPPLPEQRAIVSKLDALFERVDTAIALVKENMAHTEALMGSVLDEEFGNKTNKLVTLEYLIESTKNNWEIDVSSIASEPRKRCFMEISSSQLQGQA